MGIAEAGCVCNTMLARAVLIEDAESSHFVDDGCANVSI